MANLYKIISVGHTDQYSGYGLPGCVVDVVSEIKHRYGDSVDGNSFYALPTNLEKPFPQKAINEATRIPADGRNPSIICFADATIEEYIPKKEKIIMRSPEAIRKEVTEYAASVPPERLKAIPAGLKGKMVSELNRVFSCNENRRFIVGWLFTGSFANELSTSDMSEAQIAGLLHWLQPSHEKTGWVVAPMFKAEAALMYAYVAKEHVKTTTYKATGSAQKMKISPSLLSAIKEN